METISLNKNCLWYDVMENSDTSITVPHAKCLFPDRKDFVVRYAVTNNGLPSNNQFRFRSNMPIVKLKCIWETIVSGSTL
jgi:hypothetical protein